MRASHTENPSKAIDDKFLSAGYVRRFIVTLLILWTASIGLLFAWSIWEQVQQVQSVALAEARADVDRDEAFRLWISSHGGVYVPIDSRTAPNPLLASVPERDVVTPGGQHLTLMNSAYVLRQISHEYADLQIASSHLTSLKPLRPENAPDEWERAALMAFQKGQPEVYQFTEINGAPVLRLMRPIMTEESCLKCHAQQGLSVGSIRGGGAVILPTGRLWSATRGYITGLGLGIGALWVLGLLGILWSSQRFSKDAHERPRAAVSLREPADTLMERNQELRAQKEILQTIFDHIPVMINLISEEGKPSLVNHEWERTLGWTLEEIREQNVDYAAAMYQDPVQRQRMIDSLVYPSNQWEDFKTRVKDGRVIDTSWMVVRLSGGNNIGIGLDITQRVATERDLKRRMVELEALEEISAAVRAGEKREEVLPAVLDQIMAVFNAQGVSLGLLDPQRDCIVIEMGRGEWAVASGVRAPYYGGIGQQVAEAQHYYLNNAILSDSHIHQTDLVGRARALICLALIVDGQTIGLLYIGRDSPFLPSDVRLAKAAVDVLASALHRMDLYQQTDRQLERMTALRAIDQSILSSLDLEKTLNVLLEKITRLLQVDGANFLLYYPDTLTLTTAAVWGVPSGPIWDARLAPDTHAGRVALQRQIDFISDLSQVDDDLTALLRELDEPHQAGETRQVGEPFASYVGVPLVAKGELKGVLQLFNHTRLEPDPDWMGFLEAMADQAAIAIDSALLFKEQQQANARLTHAYDDTIDGWSRALDLRDKETEGHSQRVTDLTLTLARRMGVDDTRLLHIRRGARLHDIGKMGVPDRILLKPGALTPEEWEIMRNHPVYALDLLYPIDFLQPALDIPFCHHEKWDGTGYPQGLQGEAIPLSARIFAVVDVWDALTSDRPYRPAWPREKALAYIREQSGKHFDPQVVEQFLAIVSAY